MSKNVEPRWNRKDERGGNLRNVGVVELGPARNSPDLLPASVRISRAVASGCQTDIDSVGDSLVPHVRADAVAGIPAHEVRKVTVLIVGLIPTDLPFYLVSVMVS